MPVSDEVRKFRRMLEFADNRTQGMDIIPPARLPEHTAIDRAAENLWQNLVGSNNTPPFRNR